MKKIMGSSLLILGLASCAAPVTPNSSVGVNLASTSPSTIGGPLSGSPTAQPRTKDGFGTQPTIDVAPGNPSGKGTPGVQKQIFLFTVAATNNAADAGENTVRIEKIDVTVVPYRLPVSNLTLYPLENDQDANFATKGAGSSDRGTETWVFVPNSTGGKNEVVEGTSRTYVLRGDVGTPNGISPSLLTVIADLGYPPDKTGSFIWSDVRNGVALKSNIGWVIQNASELNSFVSY